MIKEFIISDRSVKKKTTHLIKTSSENVCSLFQWKKSGFQVIKGLFFHNLEFLGGAGIALCNTWAGRSPQLVCLLPTFWFSLFFFLNSKIHLKNQVSEVYFKRQSILCHCWKQVGNKAKKSNSVTQWRVIHLPPVQVINPHLEECKTWKIAVAAALMLQI